MEMKFVMPEFARDFDEKKDASKFGNPKYVVEKKADGWRLGLDKDLVWTGRKGINRVLPFLKDLVDEGTRIDGEIVDIDEKLSSHDISHLISEEKNHCKLKMKAFDIMFLKGEWLGKISRRNRMVMLGDYFEKKLKASGRIELMGKLENKEPLVGGTNDLIEMAAMNGWEGLMLKDLDSGISPGSRANMVKWKFSYPVDVAIIDAEGLPSEWTVRPGAKGCDGKVYAEGTHTDPWLKGYKNLRYGWYDVKTGLPVIVGSLGYTGPAEELKKFIGLACEVKVYGIYPTGALKHPQWLQFRDKSDKDARDCKFDFEKGCIV